MAPAGPRVQKPVGSAAWISTEKENFAQLVNQEMEEIEYPVRHEMDWLNEHMAEVFSSNQLCVLIYISIKPSTLADCKIAILLMCSKLLENSGVRHLSQHGSEM
jgi:hypothetical protein